MSWELVSEKSYFECPFLSLYEEVIATPSCPNGIAWYVARRPQAVVVAPRAPNGDFLLIHQERVSIRREIWEFPAGQADAGDRGCLLQTAYRELAEEAGVETQSPLVPLGHFFSSPGFTSEQCHLFLAEEVQPRAGGATPEATEVILECRAFSCSELRRMVACGEIVDANTLAIFARLAACGSI
jgi:8-oxo-dGTP pyrophosphatase MutT (NUDIX family)